MNEWNISRIPEILSLSAFLCQFSSESWNISSFSRNIREIPTKIHQHLPEKWPNSSTKIKMKWNFISFRPKLFVNDDFLWNFEVWAVRRQRNLVDLEKSWNFLNASFLAIVAVDTAENEPLKVWGVSFHSFNPILIKIKHISPAVMHVDSCSAL